MFLKWIFSILMGMCLAGVLGMMIVVGVEARTGSPVPSEWQWAICGFLFFISLIISYFFLGRVEKLSDHMR